MPYLMQKAFNAGEWSGSMEGRTDLDKYSRAVYQLENMLLDPRGPAVMRPGFRYIATAKGESYLASFDFGAEQSYVLEFGDYYIRFYKDQAQIMSGGVPYEIPTGYAVADVPLLLEKSFQSYDVLYLVHPDYPPSKLSRTAHTSWVLSTINFNPPAVSEIGHDLTADLTLSALTGTGITITASANVFITGDVKRLITSGVGKCSITAFNAANEIVADVIDDFTDLTISSGDWKLLGSPYGTLTPSIKGPVGAICTLASTGSSETFSALLENATFPVATNWELSGIGNNEYYIINTATKYTSTEPDKVYENNIEMVQGIIGELGIRQWAWGDNDTLGYNTIYVRLSDETDPDTKISTTYLKRSTITTAGDIFRTTDLGKFIRIYGGMVKLTAIASATSASGELLKVMTSIEDGATIEGTVNWTLESNIWTDDNGYPSCGCFFGERLCLAGSPEFPDTVWGSVVGDYENFTPGVDDSDSFEFSLGARKANIIRWMEPEDFLLIGTMEKVWKMGSTGTNEPLTPLNVEAKLQTATKGVENISPVQCDQAILYVQKFGRKVRELTWSWENEKYVAPDMTLLSEHMTEGVIKGITYQGEPNSILWCWQEDGSIIGLTYLRGEEVIGWHRHPMDNAFVESMAVIPGDGYDELWAVIKRTIDGSTVRYVECMGELFNEPSGTFAANNGLNAFFVDSGITYNGASTATITGLDHLEGEEVVALADGAYVTTKTVSGGSITLPRAASVVHAGLPYTATLIPMRLNADTTAGSSQARLKKIHDVSIRVYRSGSVKVGRDSDHLDVVINRDRQITMGGAYELYTGDLPVQYDDNWEPDARITIVQDKPLPFTLTAIMYDVDFK